MLFDYLESCEGNDFETWIEYEVMGLGWYFGDYANAADAVQEINDDVYLQICEDNDFEDAIEQDARDWLEANVVVLPYLGGIVADRGIL